MSRGTSRSTLSRSPFMNLKRIKAITKLVLLFGTPLAVIFGLFGAGVHCGLTHRPSILAFERDWLGIAVGPDAPGEAPALPAAPAAPPGSAPPGAAAHGTPPGDPASSVALPSVEADPPAVSPSATPPAVEPAPTSPTGGEPAAETGGPTPAREPEPVPDALAEPLATPVTLSLKVLVAPELVEADPHWIDDVQRTVAEAGSVFVRQFGIRLELASVGRASVASAGMNTETLWEIVQAQPREGAEILLLFGGRAPLGGPAWPPEASPDGGEHNRAHGLVFASSGASRPDLRAVLRELCAMMGATVVRDAEDPAFRGGSWMADAPVPRDAAPWIDGPNRIRVLEHKFQPFTGESAASSDHEPSDPAQPGDSKETDG